MSLKLDEGQIDDLLEYIGTKNPNYWKQGDKLVCCPVHQETNPSMGISVEKQVCHCFSCGFAGGFDKLLAFSMPEDFGIKYNSDGRLNYASVYRAEKKAREFLATRYELEYRELGSKLKIVKRYDQLNEKIIKADKRVELPRYKLAPFKCGKETYGYFFNRNFNKEDMKTFNVGRDLDNRTVILPVFYEDGVLAGIIGRYIDKNRKKNQRYKIYDNFERSNILYPLNISKPKDGVVILVEGQFDVMYMHRLGYTNTYATMTNSLSRKQAEWLCKNCDTVIWVGDNDERGFEGREYLRNLLKNRIDFKVVDYPDYGKDVCDWSEEDIDLMLKGARSLNVRHLKRL